MRYTKDTRRHTTFILLLKLRTRKAPRYLDLCSTSSLRTTWLKDCSSNSCLATSSWSHPRHKHQIPLNTNSMLRLTFKCTCLLASTGISTGQASLLQARQLCRQCQLLKTNKVCGLKKEASSLCLTLNKVGCRFSKQSTTQLIYSSILPSINNSTLALHLEISI